MSRHSFDPQIAAQVGLNAAVIYQNLSYWIEKNAANGHNFKDGRYWTYNSVSAFAKLFPYLTEKQIRTAIDKLLDAGLVLKGNYSDDRYDRTAWYALNTLTCLSGQVDLPAGESESFAQRGECLAPAGKSLRNRYNPDRKPSPKRVGAQAAADSDMEVVWAAFPADRRRDRASSRRLLASTLAEVTLDELTAAAKVYAEESKDYTRSKVSFLDNWLREGRWRRHVDELRQRAAASEAAQRSSGETVLANAAAWVMSRSAMCRHLTEAQVAAAVERGLISRAEAQAAGFMQ